MPRSWKNVDYHHSSRDWLSLLIPTNQTPCLVETLSTLGPNIQNQSLKMPYRLIYQETDGAVFLN